MKQKPDFETPFEETLSDFEHVPLPADWKNEMIANAVSQADDRKIVRFPSFTKIAITALAACWVVIGLLHATTPSNAPTTVAKNTEANTNDLPMLAQYIEARNSLASNY